MIRSLFLLCIVAAAWGLSDRYELFDKYGEIFPHGSRNAASHRWATYILERSADMSETTLRDLFAGFCPVSGSPLSYSRGVSRWNMTLPKVTGGTTSGMLYYCCWPCVCDTADFINVDTKTVKTTDGERQYHFAVIGNACQNSDAIPPQAPDVNCEGSEMVKATLSDRGYIIIGMFFEPGVKRHSDATVESTNQDALAQRCQERADTGHQSGMGMIFREVAAISPIVAGAHLHQLPHTPDAPDTTTASVGMDAEANAAVASRDASTTPVTTSVMVTSPPVDELSAACSQDWVSATLVMVVTAGFSHAL